MLVKSTSTDMKKYFTPKSKEVPLQKFFPSGSDRITEDVLKPIADYLEKSDLLRARLVCKRFGIFNALSKNGIKIPDYNRILDRKTFDISKWIQCYQWGSAVYAIDEDSDNYAIMNYNRVIIIDANTDTLQAELSFEKEDEGMPQGLCFVKQGKYLLTYHIIEMEQRDPTSSEVLEEFCIHRIALWDLETKQVQAKESYYDYGEIIGIDLHPEGHCVVVRNNTDHVELSQGDLFTREETVIDKKLPKFVGKIRFGDKKHFCFADNYTKIVWIDDEKVFIYDFENHSGKSFTEATADDFHYFFSAAKDFLFRPVKTTDKKIIDYKIIDLNTLAQINLSLPQKTVGSNAKLFASNKHNLVCIERVKPTAVLKWPPMEMQSYIDIWDAKSREKLGTVNLPSYSLQYALVNVMAIRFKKDKMIIFTINDVYTFTFQSKPLDLTIKESAEQQMIKEPDPEENSAELEPIENPDKVEPTKEPENTNNKRCGIM